MEKDDGAAHLDRKGDTYTEDSNYRKRKTISHHRNEVKSLFIDGFIDDICGNAKTWIDAKGDRFNISNIHRCVRSIEEYISRSMKLSSLGEPFLFETKYNSEKINKILKYDGFGNKDDHNALGGDIVSYDNYTDWSNSKNIYMVKNGRTEVRFNVDKNYSDAMGLLCQLPLNGLFLLEVYIIL